MSERPNAKKTKPTAAQNMTISPKRKPVQPLPNPAPNSKEAYRAFASQYRDKQQDTEAYMQLLEAERENAIGGWHDSAKSFFDNLMGK